MRSSESEAFSVELPKVWPWLLRGFGRFVARDLRRNFNALRMLRDHGPEASGNCATVFYSNHPSWWDPMILVHLARTYFPENHHYGPIDADALKRYPLFHRLGFFGVERGSAAGARSFLRIASALCERATTNLWVTPEGRFTDIRQRPVRLEAGLAHLAIRLARRGVTVRFVPLALEYAFWEERRPEILIAFGPEVTVIEESIPSLTAALSQGLESTMDVVADASRSRRAEAFETLLMGKAGINPAYDALRRIKAMITKSRFEARHGDAPPKKGIGTDESSLRGGRS